MCAESTTEVTHDVSGNRGAQAATPVRTMLGPFGQCSRPDSPPLSKTQVVLRSRASVRRSRPATALYHRTVRSSLSRVGTASNDGRREIIVSRKLLARAGVSLAVVLSYGGLVAVAGRATAATPPQPAAAAPASQPVPAYQWPEAHQNPPAHRGERRPHHQHDQRRRPRRQVDDQPGRDLAHLADRRVQHPAGRDPGLRRQRGRLVQRLRRADGQGRLVRTTWAAPSASRRRSTGPTSGWPTPTRRSSSSSTPPPAPSCARRRSTRWPRPAPSWSPRRAASRPSTWAPTTWPVGAPLRHRRGELHGGVEASTVQADQRPVGLHLLRGRRPDPGLPRR